MSPEFLREAFERGNSAAVLPSDPRLDHVLLIRRFLISAHLAIGPNRLLQARAPRGDRGGWLHDRPHGACARLPAEPGGPSERIETFVAEGDLAAAGGAFGFAEKNEDIRAEPLDAEQAIALLDARSTPDRP